MINVLSSREEEKKKKKKKKRKKKKKKKTLSTALATGNYHHELSKLYTLFLPPFFLSFSVSKTKVINLSLSYCGRKIP